MKNMKSILLIPIGAIDAAAMKAIARSLNKTFQSKVEIGNEFPLPQDVFNRERGQYYSSAILRYLSPLRPDHLTLVLGVTDVDLYVPELNFVFGEADIYGGAALISLTRLQTEFYGLSPDRKLFHTRAIKEAVHEIGHLYGLGHCPDRTCIMHFSNSIRDTDIKGPDFCKICRKRLGA
ncbi:MAG: archaemetzincin family Zn-dependent metalloprotease [Nitrospira sp.]|nr:archaemetzincin family Zn-dependent metalloprotease [Nitrospira sp.]